MAERSRSADVDPASSPGICTKRRGHQAKRRASAWHQKSLASLGSTSRASRKITSSTCHIARGSPRCVSSAASASRVPTPQITMISAGLASTPSRAGGRRQACSRSNRNPDQVFVNQDATPGMRPSAKPGIVRNGAPGTRITSLVTVSSKLLRFKSLCATAPMSRSPAVPLNAATLSTAVARYWRSSGSASAIHASCVRRGARRLLNARARIPM